MKRRLATIYFAAMLLIGIALPSLHAQDADTNAENLKGISAVCVLIEDLPDSAKALGLSEDAIQNDVELSLKISGMRIVTQEESQKLPGRPFVYVKINATQPIGAVSMDISLIQDTVLTRNGEVAPGLVTWQTGSLLANPGAKMIRDQVKDRVDALAKAWLSANPQETVRRQCNPGGQTTSEPSGACSGKSI